MSSLSNNVINKINYENNLLHFVENDNEIEIENINEIGIGNEN